MTILVWAVTIAVTAYSAYRIGRRVEVGKRELEADDREELAHARGQRPGTVRLSPLKIRR